MKFLVTTDSFVNPGWTCFYERGVYFYGNKPIIHRTFSGNLIASNAMIYNYMQLDIATPSSIITIFEYERIHDLRIIDGSFAAVYFDGQNIIVCRDAYGIEPLFWGETPNGIWVANYVYVHNSSPFPPGRMATIDIEEGRQLDNIRPITYYPLVHWADNAWHGILRASPEHHQRVIQCYLRDALLKASAHGEVVYMLSGGVASTILVYLATQIKPNKRVRTVAIGFDDSPDLLAAEIVAKHLNTHHVEIKLDYDNATDIIGTMARELKIYDSDVLLSAIPTYLAAKRLRLEGYNTLITGDGAQAIWGGFADNDMDFFEQRKERVRALHRKEFQGSQYIYKMAGLRCLVPYVDTPLIDVSMNIHASFKCPENALAPDKPALRASFADIRTYLTRPHIALASGVGAAWMRAFHAKHCK